jgi:hypothetical protein
MILGTYVAALANSTLLGETVSMSPDNATSQTTPGWVGCDRDEPELDQLRAHLLANNGIKGLDSVAPEETTRAKHLFYRDGFVVIRDVLTSEQLSIMQAACTREISLMLGLDDGRRGNRGSHRYSFGWASKTRHLMHLPEWAMLVDLPALTPALTAIFDSPEYICRGGGGDFCLPGAVEYQALHADINDRATYELKDGQRVSYGAFHDPEGRLTIRDLPCPYVTANVLMTDFNALNGPTRQIPGTQHSHQPMPSLEDEPGWMRLSTVMPASAGSVLLRDPRAWHGGTPNVSDEVRAIPNVEFYAPWFRELMPISMPHHIHEMLTDHGRHITRYIVARADEQLDVGYHRNLGGTPPSFKTAD